MKTIGFIGLGLIGGNIAEYIENAELKCKVAICKDIAVLRPYINCKKVRT